VGQRLEDDTPVRSSSVSTREDFVGSRCSTEQPSGAIQVETPNRGSTQRCTANQAARNNRT
jgi:hypothetical protein